MPNIAPDSLATAFGSNLAPRMETGSAPYPTMLGGISLRVVDSAGAARLAPLLFVSPAQLNYLVPKDTAPGTATIEIVDASGNALTSHSQIQTVAPGLFTANANGQGVVAAKAIQTIAPADFGGPVPVYECGSAPGSCVSVPIRLGIDTPIFVTFYATGLRGRSSDAAVKVRIDGQDVPVRSISAADDASAQAGVDEVTVVLVLSLRNSGETDVTIAVHGTTSNAGRINVI
jgi:uncharacterized protein (TIGR03437 family)